MSRSAHFGGAMSPITICFAVLLISSSTLAERWSRQLTSEGSNGEWIPLNSDGRQQQAQARVLVEPQFQNTFFPQDYVAQGGARQLFIQPPNAVPQQNFIPRSQSQPIRLTLTSQFNPLPQSFSFPRPNSMPYNEFRQSIQAQFQQPHLVVPPVQLNNQFYNQPTSQQGVVLAPQNPPSQQSPNKEVSHFASPSTERSEPNKPNLPTLKDKLKKEYSDAPAENQQNVPVNPSTPAPTNVEKEEVQLLYVPLETLQNKRFDVKQFLKNPMKQMTLRDSIGSPVQINNQLYPQTTPAYIMRSPAQLNNIKYDIFQQQMNAQLFQGGFPRDPQFNHPSSVTPSPFSQATRPIPVLSTPKSKKLKAHQPPLAVYMVQNGKERAKLHDVLTVLKESSSVTVLDSIPPNAPKIFIGPNNLKTPSNIAKFELPYLSSIDGNRIPRKIESLPFFVAPLSYKAPNGFAKIPFPAPHVGSVIVNPYMKDVEESSTTLNFDSQSTFNTFPQSTTETFRATEKDPVPTKPTFNYFPSTTNSQSFPTSFPSIKSSSVPFPTISDQYNSIYSTKNPESNLISSSKAPSFYQTSARPTAAVSFFGFSEPTFNTHPTTTHKPSTPLVYDNRGHYITNAAADTPRPPQRQNSQFKESFSERPSTSAVPSSHISNSPFNLITPFVLRNPYEPKDYIQNNVRGNEIRHFNQVVDRPVIQNNNQFSQPKYPQFQSVQQRPEIPKINFQYENTFSTPAYPTEPSPTAGPSIRTTLTPVRHQEQYNVFHNNQQFNGIRNQEQNQFNAHGDKEIISGFVPSFNQYTNPDAETDAPQVTSENEYFETETPAYEPTTTPSTTTTTSTTTTPAPTTRSYTRRPINRGRPRYTTTPKSEGDETTLRPTTRRTPLRERRPSTYRSRTTTTTTTDSSVDSEVSKPRDFGKVSRFSSRNKDDGENTTTESSKTTRNPRLRTRGRVHFKTSDNYEGSDFVSKKRKDKDGPDDLAYQRDVLHQNYPVTLSERLSTLEVRTTTAIPSSTPNNNYSIRIYETTGSTQKPFSTSYETSSEQPQYENEAVFEQEPEKFLTHPEEYVEINGKNGGRTTPIQHHSTEDKAINFSPSTSTTRYEETEPQTVSEEYFEAKFTSERTNAGNNGKHEDDEKIETHGDGGLTYKYAPDVPLTESPVPKFRTKLKNRPKLLQSLNAHKQNDDDNQNIGSNTFVTSTRKFEETTTEGHVFTRKSTPSSITHRPAFNSRRTTMRIEEIEEELKAKRTQLRHSSRSSTNKYPIYIPERTSTTPSTPSDENDVTTTQRPKVIRKRPIRITTPSSIDSPVTESVTSEKPLNTKVRRVRVRTKVRKTTTERAQPENVDNEAVEEERTTRLSQQKYPTRTRQRYFKRPVNLSDKNEQSAENVDDQASFDSINRPEIIKFIPETGNHEYVEYNVENGKAETQWSPKTNSNAFRPMFNPNLIADGHKNDDYDYGSKLSLSEISLAEPEIITAGNPYEGDILLTVTPPTNNINSKAADRDTRKQKEYIAETPSTFETVLEEVMRNLEQDESDYMTVVKHEGGEIGEIPPESTIKPNSEKDATESTNEVQPTTASLPTTVAEKRFFSTAPDLQVSSTERQARRRGGWRKVNVRPVQKDVLLGAESQFYKNSKNELVNEQKIRNKYEKVELNKANNNVRPTAQEVTTVQNVVHQTTQESVTYREETSQSSEAPKIEEQTEYPDLIAMEVSEDDVTYSPRKENDVQGTTEIENNTEYLMSRTDQPVQQANEDKKEIVTEQEETITTEQPIVEEAVKEIKVNQTENVVEKTTEKAEDVATTTVQPETEEKANETEKTDEEPPSKSFLEVMEELLGVPEEEQITKTVTPENEVEEKQNDDSNSKATVENKDVLETTTSSFKFFDPSAIISTSVSTEISHETEICYRGKCVKSKKVDNKK